MKTGNLAASAAPRRLPALIAKICPLLLASWFMPWIASAQVSQTWLDANASNDWSTAAANWQGPAVWTNGNDAIFGGTGEIVEVASDLTIRNITFNSSGYTIADANSDSQFALSSDSVITVATGSSTISEIINSGALTKAGAATLILSGANTFDGAVSVTTGTLVLGHNSALGSITGSSSVSGTAMIELQNGITITGEAVSVGSAGDNYGGLRAGANASATWAGNVILNTGNRLGALSGGLLDVTGVIQNGTSNGLVISATGSGTSLGIVRVSTAATYTGSTTIVRGRLQLGIDGALPSTTVLDIDLSSAAEDSIFDLNGHVQTLAGLTRSSAVDNGAGGSFVTNSSTTAGTLTISGTGSNSYSGIIQDGAGVVSIAKGSSGTQTLSGNNTYSGTTAVSGGTLIMSGNNTLPGAITLSSGILTLSGNNSLGALTVTSGTMTLSGSNTIAGNIQVSAALNLSGSNTLTGSTFQVNSGGVVTVGNNASLGSGAMTVGSGGRVVLQNGITVSGKTITIAGTGGNNNGALQTEVGGTATWSGNIVVGSSDARIGGGDNGTLIVNGVISGSNGVLFSRGTSATTILNNLNTYTGDTQMYASAGTGARLVIGVDNAISSFSRLSVYASATPTVAMTLDLNGHVLAMSALDTSVRYASGAVLFVQNNGAAPSIFTLSGSGLSAEQVFNGTVRDGTSGAGGLSLVKSGAFTQTFVTAQGYTGSTTVNAGTLQIGKASVAGFTGSNGALASTSFILNGGILALDNLGTNNNNANRLADTAPLSFRGGSFIYRGSDLASSTETLGVLTLHSRRSVLTASYAGSNAATLAVASLSRAANGGTLLVNGANLGLNGSATASVSRILFATAPDLVGTTAALSTGINSAAKNTQIVPGLLGEAAATTGGAGTATGAPNTFVTYEATTGLRPLNLTDEFTANTFTSGNNILITSATSLSASTTINSLILSGANATIGAGKTLTVTSGNILFSSGSGPVLGNGGTLDFGGREGIITINSTGNTFVSALITGSAGVSYYGTGTLVVNQQSTYTGATGLYVGTVISQVSSTGTAGSPVSGPYGTGTLILAGSSMRATSSGNILVHNNVDFRADTNIIAGSAGRTLTFAGDVSLTAGSRTLTHGSESNTYFNGTISETTAGSGLTIAGSGAGAVVLSGNNSYTGPTTLTGSTTLLINGNQSAATGAVIVSAGTIGGTGTIGGATTVQTGGTLSPGDPAASGGIGTLSFSSGITLNSGSITSLQISGATFTSNDSFGGNEPGTPGYAAYVLAHAGGSGGTQHDQLIFTGAVTQETGAKINVVPLSFTAVNGQIINLFDWSDLSGTSFSGNLGPNNRDGASDSAFDLDLPDISGTGYAWDTSFFASNGILVVIPEPSRMFLLFLGLGGFFLRRRRR